MKLDMADFDKLGVKIFGPFGTRFKDDAKIEEFKDVLPEFESFITSR